MTGDRQRQGRAPAARREADMNNVIPFRPKRQTTPQEIGEAIIRACERDPRAKMLLRNIALAWQAARDADSPREGRPAANQPGNPPALRPKGGASEPSRRSPRQSRNVE